MESIITDTAVIPPAISPNADSDTEQELTNAIIELWSTHAQVKSNIKKTKADLATVRTNLAERLHMMKQILARPGRGGQWSGFLSQHGISRTSADRLVSSHEKSLNPDGNSTSGAITDEEIEKMAQSVWSKLEKKLVNHLDIYQFFSKLIVESHVPYETFDDGVLILLPLSAQEAPAPTTTPLVAL